MAALSERKDVSYLQKTKRTPPLESKDGFIEGVYVPVFPRRRGIYESERLQEFMLGLIPGITPDYVGDFAYIRGGPDGLGWYPDKLCLGRLEFSETVGRATIEIDDANLAKEITNGGREVSVELKRATIVMPFPNKPIAESHIRRVGEPIYSYEGTVLGDTISACQEEEENHEKVGGSAPVPARVA